MHLKKPSIDKKKYVTKCLEKTLTYTEQNLLKSIYIVFSIRGIERNLNFNNVW